MSKELATGMVIRQGALQWTTLRGSSDRYAVVNSRTVPLDMEGMTEADFSAIAEAQTAMLSRRMKTVKRNIGTVLSIGLAPSHSLLRVVELPTVDPAELREMVRLQVDKFSPFPTDSVVSSHEVLNRTEATSMVLIAAAQRKTVDPIGSALDPARIYPRRVDVETLGWYRLLADAGEIVAAGCQIVLIRDVSSCEMIVTLDAVPLLFRSLGNPESLTDEDLCSEIDFTLTTLEAEHGIGQVALFSLWHWGTEPPELLRVFRERYPMEAQAKQLESLPSLSEGLARRSFEKDGAAALNLAPPEWRAGERRRRVRRNLVTATVLILLVLCSAVAGLFGWIRHQDEVIKGKEESLAELTRPANQARAVRRMAVMTEQCTRNACSALDFLREIAVLKPPNVEFRQFKYSGTRREVAVHGETTIPAPNPVYDFESALQKSQLFEKDRIKVKDLQATPQGRYTFKITMTNVTELIRDRE